MDRFVGRGFELEIGRLCEIAIAERFGIVDCMGFVRRDEFMMCEQVQDDLLAFFRRFGMCVRFVPVRFLRDAAEERGLGTVELGRVESEIKPRGRLDPVDLAAARDAVQVFGQDLVLRLGLRSGRRRTL